MKRKFKYENQKTSRKLEEIKICKGDSVLSVSRRDIFYFIFINISTYTGIGLLIVIGHLKDFFNLIFNKKNNNKMAPILSGYDYFYIRRIYKKVEDCWNRPIASCPGSKVDVLERDFVNGKCELNGKTKKCINLSSYNYLGFASTKSTCQLEVLNTLRKNSITNSTNRSAFDTTLLKKVEEKIAIKTGKEAVAVYSMGFGCNSNFIPFLAKKGDLILSDAKNHSSIINGCFASEASVKVFSHNDPKNLERVLRQSIVSGQHKSHRPWERIFVIIEGLYSMEGYYPRLKEIVELKKKYKFYLYVDEAHSFGAVGSTGRGICEKLNIDVPDVDILMGTFTKSYGSFGGFIASSKAMIDEIKESCSGFVNSHSLPPVICQQIVSALDVFEPQNEGTLRIKKLHFNSNYFRQLLVNMGLEVLGDEESPVLVVVIGTIAMLAAFSRECLKRKLAVVVAGFPATTLTGSRVRFCISSAHTVRELDQAAQVIETVCDKIHYKPQLAGRCPFRHRSQ